MIRLRLTPIIRFRISTLLSVLIACLVAQASAQAQPAPTPTPPSQKRDISISKSVMDPRNVADIFGKRVSRRYIAVQITISNRNPDFQYLIHDVRLGVEDIYLDTSLKPRKDYFPTSEDKTLIRGVAEKGQIYDPSNFILRALRATGNIAASVIGIASVGPAYAPTVAMFNGPVLTSYRDVFPDMTINQMNRLNDSAYAANTLVPKQSSKVLVAFLPYAMIMDSKYAGKFWNDPLSIAQQIDLRNLKSNVDGSFITVVEEARATIRSVEIPADEMAKFGANKPEVKGEILGRFLDNSELFLDEPGGIKLTVNGSPEENRIRFTLNADGPVAPGTTLHFTVAKNGRQDSRVQDVTEKVEAPTLTSMDKSDGPKGDTVNVVLTGTNFFPGDNKTRILVTPDDHVDGEPAIQVTSKNIKSATSIEIGVRISEKAAAKEYEVRVITPGGISNPQKFRVSTAMGGSQ